MKTIKFGRIIIACTFMITILGCANHLVAADRDILALDNQLPAIKLTTPEDQSLRNFLGLPEKESFSVEEIKCEILIIEIFSMYCPHCQKDAPAINELYELIESDKKVAGRVKMIGIGTGNSAFEIDVFKKKYKIPFPLFADADFTVHEYLGNVRTPYFIGICNQGKIKNRIFFSQLSGFNGAEKFLDTVLKASNCKQEK
ncbi:MAG: TlpA disulfide reductase family protein [Pseudomonadota bacterium]|nr:TlpA disulfide reductase family protein [Pseudomonadota bacterium]